MHKDDKEHVNEFYNAESIHCRLESAIQSLKIS